MMRPLAIAIVVAFAAPVAAQTTAPHSPEAAPHAHHATPAPTAVADPKCPPEHAAMGHCTPAAPAAPQPAAAIDPKCPPEHAAMGHCAPVAPAPKVQTPAASDPACPPEHAAMGHCTPAAPAAGQGGHGDATAQPPRAGPSAAALTGPEHAADTVWGVGVMAPVRRAIYAEHGAFRGGKVLIDRLEYRAQNGRDGYAWEGEAWYGGDYDRLWLKTEGEGGFGGKLESAEVQALWSHALDPWFNLQTGVRYDIRPNPDRVHIVLGIQGLAPYWLEVDAAAFLSDRGDLTARVEAEYDQRITNQLILQPRLEVDFSAQDIPAIHVGSGLSSAGAGLRLRYEVVPEFAPYIGVEYERRFGRTARYARAEGEHVGGWALVAGVRLWF
nr:copper resistance protein B [Sphingomonas sp. Y57]